MYILPTAEVEVLIVRASAQAMHALYISLDALLPLLPVLKMPLVATTCSYRRTVKMSPLVPLDAAVPAGRAKDWQPKG